MPFQAVLFDCDGVLVDSEPITNGVLRDMLEERGWTLSQPECARIFIGHTVREMRDLIEEHTRQPFTEEWLQSFYARRNAALDERLVIMAGAQEAVMAARAHTQDCIACASGADRFKVELQLRKVGLLPHFEGRIFSGHETPRSKPAPDVYLAAMAHLGVAPDQCLVIEDTFPGATAGLAAGATVWGLCPHGDGRAFQGLPVQRLIRHMGELTQLL
jgi:HAD superfamily hydrolase (TIGR01509 family)